MDAAATPPESADWFVGLMSGTSLDGVDAVLARFHPQNTGADSGVAMPLVRDCHLFSLPWPAGVETALRALNTPGANELHRAALAGAAVARVYAQAVQQALAHFGVAPQDVRAIGAHGQTVRHHPAAPADTLDTGLDAAEAGGSGYTWQLLSAPLLAELTGIDVVADFRSRDIAAGGQGAPLVPAFQQALLAGAVHSEAVAVLNLGGIANWSVLDPALAAPAGFDCGPANTLMDAWCRRHTGQPFDRNGAWAASGQVLPDLLAVMRAEPYFELPPPKSTGLELFNLDWLQRHLDASSTSSAAPQDVQATLLELTARSAIDALLRVSTAVRRVLVCGGGAANPLLMRRLTQLVREALGDALTVETTAALGLPPQGMEALAFAWLAERFCAGQPANLPAATGARGLRRLGALHPA
ncbi:anhydro-N-acetylmuramic acid kinase [Amphibiibacter pelophylacis]|uniref:Anhydro-N-acetylmuramic acid kinase n=1 Tax=Amphibiibacter pelophylacis TaxID=1799477 RepID=A0ACC6NY18_9BURK